MQKDKINIYYGVSKDIPQDIDKLRCEKVDPDELLKNGMKLLFDTHDEYSVIALDSDCGIKLDSIKQSGFTLEKIDVQTKSYNIYYGEERSTDIATVVCEFEKTNN